MFLKINQKKKKNKKSQLGKTLAVTQLIFLCYYYSYMEWNGISDVSSFAKLLAIPITVNK